MVRRASRALREVAGADHLYAAVLGNRVPHLHVHLVARYPGTPQEYLGLKADEWPGAERGTAPQVAEFVTRLRAYLAQSSREQRPARSRATDDHADWERKLRGHPRRSWLAFALAAGRRD